MSDTGLVDRLGKRQAFRLPNAPTHKKTRYMSAWDAPRLPATKPDSTIWWSDAKMMHPNREVKGISVEYVLWAFAAFGLFSFAAIMAGAIRFNRARRWEDRLDAMKIGLDSLLHLVSTGVLFSDADKEAALSLIVGEVRPGVADKLAFEQAFSRLSVMSMREMEELGRLAQAQSRHFQAADATSRALALTAVCLAFEAERLRRTARDQMGEVIANGSAANALMAIWPQPDLYP